MRRWRQSGFRLANAPPPGFLAGAGSPVVCCSILALEEKEGARNAGVTLDPRASMPRGTKAARSRAGRLGLSARCCRLVGRQRRKSAVTSGVPRAVFEACSVGPPVDRLFRRRPLFPLLGVQRLSTAVGIGRCERGRTPRTHPPSYPVARSRRAGTPRLGPPRRMVRATRHGHRTNLTGLPRLGPADRDGASPPPPLRLSPRSSALERAPLVGTGRLFLIFL